MDWPQMRTNALDADPQALERAESVRLMIFDVDGVLTDGSLYIAADGSELVKAFHILDGHGVKMLGEAGIRTAIISGRDSPNVAARARALGFDHVYQGQQDKTAAFADLLARAGCTPADCGYMGDDWPDLVLMTRVGFAACPAQAHEEVRARSHYVARAAGGAGAVREVCDLILRAQGAYVGLLAGALGRDRC